jgi:hypothetical protein
MFSGKTVPLLAILGFHCRDQSAGRARSGSLARADLPEDVHTFTGVAQRETIIGGQPQEWSVEILYERHCKSPERFFRNNIPANAAEPNSMPGSPVGIAVNTPVIKPLILALS